MLISYLTHPAGLETSTGFGYAGFNIVTSLQNLGHRVVLDSPESPIQFMFTQPQDYSWHENQYSIGYTPWESTALQPDWQPKMAAVSELWCTSELNKQWFEDLGLSPTKVYPHGITHNWTPKLRKRGKKLRFLQVGGPAVRKNSQLIFDVFQELYGEDPNYTLTIKANGGSNVRYDPKIAGVLRTPDTFSNVNLITKNITEEEMVSLYHSHDILIYASCLSEDTEILTDSGWRGIDDIDSESVVATHNLKTDTLEYLPVTNTIRYEYSGEMVNVLNSSHDILVTPNHDIHVRKTAGCNRKKIKASELLDACDLKSKWEIPVVSNYVGGYDEKHISRQDLGLPEQRWNAKTLNDPINVQSLLELTGWFISEGYLYQSESQKSSTINICQSKDREKYERIRWLIEDLGLVATDSRAIRDESECITTYSMDLVNLFSQCGSGVLNKRIPEWVWKFSSRHLQSLFRGMMLGDGTNYYGDNESHHTSYYTSSEHLVADFQRLCFLLGYRTSVFTRPEVKKTLPSGWTGVVSENWQIGISKSKNSGTFCTDRDVVPSNYKGEVWCVTNDNGTIVTRRNGKISIIGNCGEGFGFIPLQGLATGMPVVFNTSWAGYKKYSMGLDVNDFLMDSPWLHEHPGRVFGIDRESLKQQIVTAAENFEYYSQVAYEQAEHVHYEYDWTRQTYKAFNPLIERFSKD